MKWKTNDYYREEIIKLIMRFVVSEKEGRPVLTFELGVFDELAVM
ncbi:hypothetical protein ACFSTH_02445 [Paenibacillus yanchengensis]|uniref:Uncharacterized protein n=1 Tax=Paenibacillus yanchengensis TaxID=2035833 RepID=A0ABW4YGJ7_9BACL